MQFKATLENLHPLLAWVTSQLSFPAPFCRQIELICEEVFMNIVNHSHSPTVDVTLALAPTHVQLTFIDAGRPFDPLHAPSPDPTQPGGLGIPLLKQLSDKLEYERAGAKNVLKIAKFYKK